MKIVIPIKEYEIRPPVLKVLSEITIEYVKDEPEFKIISAFTKEAGNIILWKGDEYDNIGQWTDYDVITKLKTIFI
jgi:hypothetical protein